VIRFYCQERKLKETKLDKINDSFGYWRAGHSAYCSALFRGAFLQIVELGCLQRKISSTINYTTSKNKKNPAVRLNFSIRIYLP
jgi:ribosomal protein L33